MYLAPGVIQLVNVVAQIIMTNQLTAWGAPRAHPPLVSGHPYVASFQTRSQKPLGVFSGHMYRDSDGRTRVDFIAPSGEEVRFIDDVITNALFIVYPDGSSEKDSYTATPTLDWMFSNVHPDFTKEHRDILGVDCTRIRFKRPDKMPGDGDFGEAWISIALGVVMKDSDPSQGRKWEVIKIQFREPDAGTFDVPKGLQGKE